jgi:hypothetical protein
VTKEEMIILVLLDSFLNCSANSVYVASSLDVSSEYTLSLCPPITCALATFREHILSVPPPQHTSSISQALSTSVWTASDAVSSKLEFQLLDKLDNIYYFLYKKKTLRTLQYYLGCTVSRSYQVR